MSSKNWLQFWASGLIWSTSFLWIKIALGEVEPLMLVAFRATFGMLGMLVIIRCTKRELLSRQSIQPWLGTFLLIGILNVALPFLLISWGEQFIPSGLASVLNSTTPLFTILLAAIVFQAEHISREKAGGLLLGFGGVVALFIPELQASGLDSILGLSAVLAASACYALSAILIKQKVHGLDSESQVLLQYGFGAVVVWCLTLLFERPLTFPHQPLTWVALLWLGFLGSSLASFMYFKLLHSVGPTQASTVTYIPPLGGLLLGALFLDETLGWQTLIGGGLILMGIMLVNRKPSSS